MLKFIYLVLLGAIVSSPLLAQEKNTTNETILWKTSDYSSVSFQAKNIKLVAKPSSSEGRSLTVLALVEPTDLIQEKKGRSLHISWKNTISVEELRIVVMGNLGDLKIVSDSLQVSLSGVELGNIDIVTKQLKFKSKGSKFSAKLRAEEGQLSVAEHSGDWDLDTYSVSSVFNKVEGKITAKSFVGQNRIVDHLGDLSFKQNKGKLSISQLEGNMNLETLSANVQSEKIKGELKGKSGLGNWVLNLSEDNRVRLRTVEGKVRVRMPGGSGSHVNIGSNEGELNYPSFLEMKRYPSIKVATGRLRGRLGGSVFVRTKTGDVSLR